MTWLRLDDGFSHHPKIVQLPRAHRWTWVEVLCYCARYKTGGKVPAAIREVVPAASPAFMQMLTDAELVEATANGWRVHDWTIYNGETVEERMLAFLADNPDASANQAARAVGGKRTVALAVYRSLTGTPTVPDPVPDVVPPVVPGNADSVPLAGACAAPAPTPSVELHESPNGLSSQNLEDDDPLDEAAIQAVYATWRNNFDKNHGRYNTITKARREKIKSRLREFSVTDLQAALRNAAADTWEGRRLHDDLLVLLKSREKVERWLDFKPATNGKTGGGLSVADILAMKEAS